MFRAAFVNIRRQAASIVSRRWFSSDKGGEAPKGLLAWAQSKQGEFVIANFSYCLQFAGFIATEALVMRSCLIGGSMSFVCYALVQPKKLIIPALWETTFASIHTYKIYEILNGDRVVLSSDELRLYALLFRHDELEPAAFHRLVELGTKETYDKGKVLTVEGRHVDHVRVLISGSVSIEMEGKHIREVDKPGTFIGEQALAKMVIADDDNVGKSTTTRRCDSDKMVCFEWPMDTLKTFVEVDEAGGALLKTFFSGVLQKLDQDDTALHNL